MLQFESAKRSGFNGLLPEQTKNLLYLEQLASTTQENIAEWDVSEFLDAPDKRAINKLFFGKKETTTIDEKLVVDLMIYTEKAREQLKISEITQAKSNRDYTLNQARAYHRNVQQKLDEARVYAKRIEMLEGRDNGDLQNQVKKIFQNPFYEFVRTDNPQPNVELGLLKFRTRKDVILTETNKAAGIDRRVNMGRYRIDVDMRTAYLKVLNLEGTLNCSGYWHPYVSASGEICWGNATDSAHKMLVEGRIGDAMELLSSLLTHYDPTSTPYLDLYTFEKEAIRRGQVPGKKTADPLADAENRCSTCDEVTDYCECAYCDACEVTYNPDDNCGGFWCDTCHECAGTSRCETHWCPICATYNAENCACCRHCGETDEDCTRCPGCDQHEGHAENCSERTREDDLPF